MKSSFKYLVAAFLVLILLVALVVMKNSSEPSPQDHAREDGPSSDDYGSTSGGTKHGRDESRRSSREEMALKDQADAERIGDILGDQSVGDSAVARRLLKLIPDLNETGQAEAAEHVANLTGDEYQTLWLPDLISGQQPPVVSEVFFNDLLNREQETMIPALAAMADNKNHGMRTDSEEILESILPPRPEDLTWSEWVRKQEK